MPVGQKPDISIPGLSELNFNPLQQYTNGTYNIRITMMPEPEAIGKSTDRSYDYKQGIILAETAGTGSTNIEMFELKNIAAGAASRNYIYAAPSMIQGRLVEPVGGRFIHMLALSAKKLGFRKTDQALYLIDIWFTGYDDNDMPVTCKGFGGEMLEFSFYAYMTEVKMEIDYRGSTYDIKMVDATKGPAIGQEITNLEQGFKVEGSGGTVEGFLKQLEVALNKREDEKVASGNKRFPHKYNLKADPKLGPLKFDWSAAGGKKGWLQWFSPGDIQLKAGSRIDEFIKDSLSQSKEVLEFLDRVKDDKKVFNDPDTKPGTIHIPSRVLMIVPGLKHQSEGGRVKWDDKINAPVEDIYYYVTYKEDPKLVMSAQEAKDAHKIEERVKRLQLFVKQNLVRKVYKWIYTGENTEVLNTKLKLDYLWRLARPLFIDENGHPVGVGANTTPSRAVDPAPPVQSPQGTGPGSPQGSAYAEDFVFQKSGDEIAPVPETTWTPHQATHMLVNTSAEQQITQSATFASNAIEYSIFKQLHAEHGSGSADLVNLTVEVVGDPFWLCQIPKSQQGGKPWEEDVWKYWDEGLNEDSLAEKRKEYSVQSQHSMFYFEAVVPSAEFTQDDLMDLNPSEAITGIYCPKMVTNKFSKGKYTTVLDAYRDDLINPYPVGRGADSPNPQGTAPNNGPAATGNATENPRESIGPIPMSPDGIPGFAAGA